MGRQKKLTFSDIGTKISEGLTRAISRPSIHGYIPHEKQIRFHSAQTKGRLYIGGNRSGKTVGGVVEDIYHLRGEHPYRPVPPPPIRGRIVTVSLEEGIKKLIIPELAKWIPPSDLINGSWEDSYMKSEKTLKLNNGSFVELMTYEQDVEKFAGTSRHFTHFDEEPPKPIFDECKMRLLDTRGSWWMTMTPLLGMTWVYDDIYLMGMLPGSNITVIVIDTSENPYLSSAEIEEVFSGIKDPNEIKMRKEGKFVEIGGLVFKEFKRQRNIIDPLEVSDLRRISGWTHYASLDHGLNNPTCWLWHAVSPTGHVITYDEVYDNEKLVGDYARAVHERNRLEGRQAPSVYVGDPAIAQRNGQTGDSIQIAYIKEGIPIVLGNNDVKIGVNKMNAYLRQGKWLITENCSNLIRELPRVRWKTYPSAKQRFDNNPREEIHKKNDHAPDSSRYFFGLMPDLYIPPVGKNLPNREDMNIKDVIRNVMGASTVPVGPRYFDDNLRRSKTSTEWTAIDEQMGGLF